IQAYPGRFKVILSNSDTTSSMTALPEILSFMAHESTFRPIKGARVPWPFGLSHERIENGAAGLPFEQRRPVLVRNFRPSPNQAIRNVLDLTFVPHLSSHFTIDRTIADNHFERLKSSLGCLAYCGHFEEDFSPNPYFAQEPGYMAYRQAVSFLQQPMVTRWDNWRWWESLSSGCLTFHLDFEKYGLALPVLPVPWEHYIPVDLAEPKAIAEKLIELRPRWAEIAANGKVWALANYSPIAVAERFIRQVSS
ncbi:MAG TPA: hypothetical protein VKC60_18770, partial [Opitutaceae bacterium]|nr:hypothetical protein [Opitutaceae bacterium]